MGGSIDGSGGAPSTGGFEEGREQRQRRIVVAFRGTCSSTNWKTDCRCWHPTSISDFYDSESLEHTASLFTDTSSAILERYEAIAKRGGDKGREGTDPHVVRMWMECVWCVQYGEVYGMYW
jgi:hypothetical protein